MDKYTVDLDKVLNDFEYSELTESTEHHHVQQPQQQQPPVSQHSLDALGKNGAVKHSINNVFNSLNEYLNTEIASGCSYEESAKLSEAAEVEEDYVKAAVNCFKQPPGDFPGVNETHDFNSKMPNDSTKVDYKRYLSDSFASNLDDFMTNDNTQITNEFDYIQDIKTVNRNDFNSVKDINNELGGIALCGKSNLGLEVSSNVEQVVGDDEEAHESNTVEDLQVMPSSGKNNVKVCNDAGIKVGSNDVSPCANGNVEVCNEDVSVKVGNTCGKSNVDVYNDIKATVELEVGNNDVLLCERSDVDVNNDVSSCEKSNLEVINDTKFNDELLAAQPSVELPKLPTTEVGKNEFPIIEVDNCANDLVYDEICEDTTSMLKTTDNNLLTKDDLKVVAETTIQTKNDIHQIENVEQSSGDTKKETETKEEICDNNNKEVTPIGFDSTLEIDEDELNKYLDDLDDENTLQENPVINNNNNVKESQSEDLTSINSETYESCSENVSEHRTSDASERPSSLDINAKQIDLIGNPGSTPYNNLYVTKEITEAKPKPENYESESSASVSPTFSEASTDSVRSTETTDSEGEAPKEAKVDDEAKTEDAAVVAATAGEEGAAATVTAEDEAKAETSVGSQEDVVQSDVLSENEIWLGKRAPVWIPDADALNCLHCDMKFTVLKRRHHCRACGLVLCSKCCSMKHRLEYLDMEARVCTRCHEVLSRDIGGCSSSGSEVSPGAGNSPSRQQPQPGQPNPNNPMEYCSIVPPMQQVASAAGTENPPTVMVPVGVLKRKGSNKAKHNKSVMFCDGIRPGSDLTNLDNDFNYNETKPVSSSSSKRSHAPKSNKNAPSVDASTKSFIPENENCLPPTVTTFKSDTTYTECANNSNVVEMLKNETLTFALQRNLHIHVRLITMECCINKQAWCFSTEGLINVGQDEIVVLLETIDNERTVPKDVFYHLNNIYNEAVKGNTVTELGLSMHPTTNFLDSKNHAGFIYIRPTFQCLKNVIIPKEPYLVGVLVHRWETPWAKIFPLRLVLRLGAEYRYYPSPLISSRHRDSVFVEIGHTIINLLADFRNFTYTLPNIRGLTIHMEGKNTVVTIPSNRYDQVMKSISNSSDHILAFGGNFSTKTDSYLVCIQDVHGNNENNYNTHSISIQNKPRKVTGASFIVFNGALKSSSGLTAKSSIVEDGLMIQIPPEQMVQVRESLRNMKNYTIQCGCVNAASDETVNVIWGEPDVNFNVGVKSCVDEQDLSGVPSIRVHNGKDYVCNSGNRLIRWTEVFLLQNGEENARTQDPVDISKVAESISKATCQALVKYLDLLATNNFYKIGIRTTLHVENVSYSAGSNGIKLPPIYMKSLDNELIPVLHRITSNSLGDGAIVLELIFRILNV